MDYEIIRIVWAWIITNGLCIAERGGEGEGGGERRRSKAKKVGEDQDTKERRGMR